MGCDIHLAVEVRERGKWRRVLPPEPARDPWLVEQAEKHSDSWYGTRAAVDWYSDRNYRVFAVLANVRNSGEITPISEPRGLPDDMSQEVAALIAPDEDSNDVSLGEHSQSWLTLAELQAYPWEGEAVETGVVSLEQFMDRIQKFGMGYPVRSSKRPYHEWCGSTMGPNIVTRDATEVLAGLRDGGFPAPAHERTHVRDKWITSANEQAGSFVDRVLPALAQLGAPNDVRIVFGFDS